jgi:chromosome segregation ATPase
MKWLANPLHYPIAVLIGGLVLVIGVRLLRLPSYVIIPLSGGIATAGASWRKSQEPEPILTDNPALAKDLEALRQTAQEVAEKAEVLRQEADRALSDTSLQLDLLTQVQYACDRAQELPSQIETLFSKFQGSDSLLSVSQLEAQLANIEKKLPNSSPTTRQQLETLKEKVQRNIELAQQGEDARQAQVISLNTSIQNLAGVLQQLQNKLRSADLADSEEINELQTLSEELNSFQANLDILTSK